MSSSARDLNLGPGSLRGLGSEFESETRGKTFYYKKLRKL